MSLSFSVSLFISLIVHRFHLFTSRALWKVLTIIDPLLFKQALAVHCGRLSNCLLLLALCLSVRISSISACIALLFMPRKQALSRPTDSAIYRSCAAIATSSPACNSFTCSYICQCCPIESLTQPKKLNVYAPSYSVCYFCFVYFAAVDFIQLSLKHGFARVELNSPRLVFA